MRRKTELQNPIRTYGQGIEVEFPNLDKLCMSVNQHHHSLYNEKLLSQLHQVQLSHCQFPNKICISLAKM